MTGIDIMKRAAWYRISFFTACYCVAGMISIAQLSVNTSEPDKFRAVPWTIEEGLSVDAMHTMIKDAKGFLWVGSSLGQLSRFDGMTFKNYIPEPQTRGAINTDKIYCFEEDSLGNIWMGTEKGLSRYDIKADTFSNISPLTTAASVTQISPFWSTKDEVLCFEQGGLITAYNIRTLKRRSLGNIPNGYGTLMHWNTNKSLFDEKSNSIWRLGSHKDNHGAMELEQIFFDGRTHSYRWPCYNSQYQHRDGAEDMQYDPKRKLIWINTGDGLLKFSLTDSQFTRTVAANELAKSNKYDRGVGVDIDVQGRIWFSTKYDGICIYDPANGRVEALFHDSVQQKKVGEANLHIYCDRNGIIWTSSWSALGLFEILAHDPPVRYFSANPNKKDSLSSPSIFGIKPAMNGEIWIGTEDGLNILDTKNNHIRVLKQKELPGLNSNSIIPVHTDTIRQKAWIVCAPPSDPFSINLYEMDMSTKKCRPIFFRAGTKLVDSLAVLPGWFQSYKNGLLFVDELHGIFEIKVNSDFAELVTPTKKTLGYKPVLVQERYIFMQYKGGMRSSFENKNGQWIQTPQMFDSLEWKAMYYNENDKTTWVCLKNELIHYDKDFRKIGSYRSEDGNYLNIRGMIADNAGNLWFNNKSGQLNRLGIKSGIITILSPIDGYVKQPSGFFSPAIDARGDIYFGIGQTSNVKSGGLVSISPEKYSSPVTSSVYLRSLLINQKPFSLSTGINNLEKLSLRYHQNTISIGTGIIDFTTKGNNRLRYKLVRNSKDENWQYGDSYTIIRYDGLVPGIYRLVIQSSNAGKEFNSPEKILTIIISPPIWQTWWFRILAVVVVMALIFGIIQYRSRKLKQRNTLLEQKVTERTNALNKSLSELKTTQDQLIHSEKMASLGELTSGIAHEIKNPLNFINNFSEINLDLITEIDNQPGKEDENEQIIKTLKKNLEKINHHGKRVDDIVKSMLQHSRVGNLAKELVNVNALCEESLKLAYHGFKAKEKTFQASYETHLDPGLPQIMVIPQELGRVLLNLFNNAFYAVYEKKKKMQPVVYVASEIESSYKPAVTLTTKKGENKIVITVSDNGTGIPQKIISKIFQPFFTTKPTGEGTGLGLSMSYDIITKSHGGELHVTSIEGRGTDFEITLPV